MAQVQMLPGGSLLFPTAPSGSPATSSGVWRVIDGSSNIVATSATPNGWAVPNTPTVTITSPSGAKIGVYSLQFYQTGSGGYQTIFVTSSGLGTSAFGVALHWGLSTNTIDLYPTSTSTPISGTFQVLLSPANVPPTTYHPPPVQYFYFQESSSLTSPPYANGASSVSNPNNFNIRLPQDASSISVFTPSVMNPGSTVITYTIKVEAGYTNQYTFFDSDTPQYITVNVHPASGGGGGGSNAVSAAGLDFDGHRRPVAASPGPTVATYMSSRDGGHSFDNYNIAGSGVSKNATAWVDPRTNTPRVLWDDGAGAIKQAKASLDGEQGDWTVTTVPFGGKYAVAARHPADHLAILAAYLDGSGSLKTLLSLDSGDTWQAWGTVAAGLDFSANGKPGLCWLPGLALVVYASGNSLIARTSADGQAWSSPVTVATAGPYQGISACASPGPLGTLYAAALSGVGPSYTVTAWKSPTLGAAWAAVTAPPSPGTIGAALAFDPRTCRLLWGTGYHSDDDGLTWPAN